MAGILTLSQMASRVLRNVQLPEDSTTSSVQALADAKQYINERAAKIHGVRNWPEYFILGSASVAASTKRITLASITPASGFSTAGQGYAATFNLAITMREGSTAIYFEDPSAVMKLKADLWDETNNPRATINRGQNGIYLLGEYTSAKTLYFYGKSNFVALTDAETWIMDADDALLAGATGDMMKFHERDDNRASINYQEYAAEIQKMIDRIDNQAGNVKRIVPLKPWTREFGAQRDTSVIGIGPRGLW